MIHVLLVNEIRLMCNVLTAALENEPEIKVIGSATSVTEALETISRESDIDVVLVSTRLPDQGALRLTETITAQQPTVNVVVFGVTEKKERVLQYVEAGAIGYVLRDDTVQDMVAAIQAAQQGHALVSPHIAGALMERVSELAQMFSSLETGVVESAGLTSRELEVLKLLGENLTNQEIAERLVIEVGTVKNHVHSILNKLNVNTRDQAAAYLALIRQV